MMTIDRARELKAKYTQTMRKAIAAGIIYNREYSDARSLLNDAFDAEWRNLEGDRGDLIWEAIRSLYFSRQLHSIRTARKEFNRTRKEKQTDDTAEAFAALDQCLTDWEEIAALVNQVKPLVVKGRKPSTNPRKTPDRTLENTGTCPVCRRNIKLEGAVMYPHGFVLEFQSRLGNCFAVGQPPWEKSPQGAILFVEVLRARLADRQMVLDSADARDSISDPYEYIRPGKTKTMFQRGDRGYEHVLRRYKQNIESEIRQLEWTLERFDKDIAEWTEQPLPDERKRLAEEALGL